MKLLFLSLISLFAFLYSQSAPAAACCGGGYAAPSIISGDDKAQLAFSYIQTDVVIDNVDSKGIWRKADYHQRVKTYRMEGAHIISDLWQVGVSIPVVERTYRNQSYSGFSDISISSGYEFLSDWDYNPYRPKGIGFLQLTLPTGKSRAESEVGGLDSRGNGFWSLGLGTLLSKSWHRWDSFILIEAHRSFEKSIDNSNIRGTLKPGYGSNLGFGAGYSLWDYRLGSGITWTHEDPVEIETQNSNYKGATERYATATVSASYLASAEWSGTLSYSDQTLFGDPINTSLGRSVSLQLQKRWER